VDAAPECEEDVKLDRFIPALALAFWAGLVAPALSQRRTDPDDIDDVIKRARQLTRSVANKGFIRYHEQLDPGNIVVLARLKKIAAGRRKRIDPEDVVEPGALGQIGRGIVGRVARATGWVFYRANGKSTLELDGVLFGPPRSDRLKVQFELQMEKNSQGKKRYVLLGPHPMELENGLYGVWILKPAAKPKGPLAILRLIPCDATPDSPKSARESFKQRQEDYCEVNVAIRLLSDAIRFAAELHQLGKDNEAKTLLQDGLKLQPKIKRPEFKEEAASLLKPFRNKAEEMLKALEGKKSDGAQPAPKPPAGEKPGEAKKVEEKKVEGAKVPTQ